MKDSTLITYKIAETNNEMEQIYRLNYETFAEEIPQHALNEERKLIDRFNDENTYVIAKRKDEVVGMICVRENRPFSLDQKLDNLDEYFPSESVPCEVRLLSIKDSYRGGRIFYGLCERLVSYCLEKGFAVALISGTMQQTKLYKHIGFQPFGPIVGSDEAPFQPMFLTKKNFERSSKVFQRLMQRKERNPHQNFLPGPVELCESVKNAWKEPAVSHRSSTLQKAMEDLQTQLCELTKANYAELAVGTGTLANDMVAAQLSTLDTKGLVLSNGEFGERLIDHGNRWRLPFEKIQKDWNTIITMEEIESCLKDNPAIQWLWTVHCETSTGYMYPLKELKKICSKYHVGLCIDACSSVGVTDVDLSDVYLATTVSGKGIASYPGIAIVFHRDQISPNKRIPGYLDIGSYQKNNSIPFTHSSNGLMALKSALNNPSIPKKELADRVCQEFRSVGMKVLRGKGYSPGVITVSLPKELSSKSFGDHLITLGIHVSYESGYLLERNWFQIALMGEQKQANVMKAIHTTTHYFNQLMKEQVTS
ncbi:aminotransferase class V-fold PLP-dependent enzyme [Virgibacillus sp. DJP39]|uniref:aminotransferase class V-fold PLP-dependent enzyme n=1 Tax=Virgibacillus sp. DJP39 TaxID=3409790 RepID=UPI003BB614B1